jgi:hypothetical protein
MPALVNINVGSFGGTKGALGTTSWPFFWKKSRKVCRTSRAVFMAVQRPRGAEEGAVPHRASLRGGLGSTVMVKRASAFLLPTLVTVFLGCGSTVSSTQFDDHEDGAVAEESGSEASGDDTATSGADTGATTDSSVIEPGDADVPPDTSVPPPDTTEPPPDTTEPPPMDTGVDCPEPTGKVYEGHCYFPIEKRNWIAARDYCVMQGAHLATITSKGEQGFLSMFGGATDRWIGLYRPDGAPYMASSYKWVVPEPVSYTNWDSGEPNFSGQTVRLKYDGSWADQSPSYSLPAICEREP